MFWSSTLVIALVGLPGVVAIAATISSDILDRIPVDGQLQRRLLVAVQPAILLVVAAAVGSAVAASAGSDSLLANAAAGRAGGDGWLAPLLWALAAGTVLGGLLYVIDRFARPLWATAGEDDLIAAWKPGALPAGILYGGFTEEVLMRWGVMGLLMWLLGLVDGQPGEPAIWAAWIAIVLSALLFAVGHLPAAIATGLKSRPYLVRILGLNLIAGLVFGWLFWRWNIETAMAAHVGFHLGAALVALPSFRRAPA